MRVGLLGGTFDPIHTGHLIVAEETRTQVALDLVIFLPAGQPWMKEGQTITSPEHRHKMVQLATESNPYFRVSRNEIDRSGPTYTVDTLAEVIQELGSDTTLYFMMGLDALEQFHLWKEPERILELCRFALATRPGYQDSDALERLFLAYPQARNRTSLLNTTRVEISSTEIRRRAARGISFRYLTPDPVERYILEHGLYSDGE